jgi:hypothetical protein
MTYLHRTLAIAVSTGFVALAVAQTTTPPPTTVYRTQTSTITTQPKPVITNPLNTSTTTRTAPRSYTRVTPVPEPSQWAMMLAGLALVGFIVRRSSKRS